MKPSIRLKTYANVGFILKILIILQLSVENLYGNSFADFQLNRDTSDVVKSDWIPITAVYFELGGKFTYSLNVDFRKRQNFAFSIGGTYWYDDADPDQSLYIPSFMAYYLGGERNRLEIGGGIGPFFGTRSGFASIMLYSNLGYRYQKKKGLIFRVGFTPWMAIPLVKDVRFWVTPWAGISLGYSF